MIPQNSCQLGTYTWVIMFMEPDIKHKNLEYGSSEEI